MSFSLAVLDFDQLLEMLAARAITSQAQELARNLKISQNFAEIEAWQADLEKMRSILDQKPGLKLSPYTDFAPSLKRVAKDASLSCAELFAILDFLKLIARVLKSEADFQETRLAYYFAQIESEKDLKLDLERSLASKNELADEASSNLALIRRQIISSQEQIKASLNSFLSSSYLQEALITIRNDRFVLPVKADFKAKIKGIVHDASASGSTVFIEPISVVNLNNKIQELRSEEKQEIENILWEFSQEIKLKTASLKKSARFLTILDLIQAKAILARDFKMTRPILSQNQEINLKEARHPLIPQDEVVAIDLRLGQDFKALVITGPNTGGKTVSLKTCGLMALMNQAGLQVPARAATLGVFTEIMADIGDEQSIEQSLSTFSAHLSRIICILKKAKPSSLILLDELGAGTDPSEGAALAISILDHLLKLGSIIMASTHYQELKAYALNTKAVYNAACEFDLESLAPTYRLQLGVAGQSHAFAIAERLGLDQEVICKAEALVKQEDRQFAEIMLAIEQAEQEAKKARLDLESLKAKLLAEKKALAEQKSQAKAEANKIVQEAQIEAYELLESERARQKEFIHRIRKAKAKEKQSMRQDFAQEIKEKIEKLKEHLSAPRIKTDLEKEDIELAKQYFVPTYNQNCTVIEPADKKGRFLVKIGAMQIRLKASDLAMIKQKDNKPRKSFYSKGSSSFFLEKNLIGMTVSDAIYELDHYLDDAVIAGIEKVRIVHGKGTGALRQAVFEFCQKDSRVKSCQLAAYGEGDSGVSVVELK